MLQPSRWKDSGFERIVDEDEGTGEMFKDAYRQEAIVDTVRAIEFEMESTTTAEVGSILETLASEDSKFERIADEDEANSAESKPAENRKSKNQRGGNRNNKKTKTGERRCSSGS